ncbi:uncharacterized protein OCT59_023345 [Rhizophagus irregularis]|uniref:Uncharacterized protein n=2 Tax=Rhizophagus irregularis TaxID=588596 RepID=A0A015KGR1_RHIIW|nr:hypothetical protein RirG_194540 [Rhizophagus irregularis DAOM 197198w]UZO29896.1 hypothetical protein OCT59_023345 [Rhizophagus irregularis]CAB4401570.1 unnamed protein product [Rhizophagus irregularis]CAG8485165.1 3331_t:CDS:1 [Rhizophagus irregularis]
MSFFMTSVARGRQEQERIRAAAFKFDDKENDGCPRKYHRSRLFAVSIKENKTNKTNKAIRRKAEKLRKRLFEKCTFIPLGNIKLEKDKEIRQGFIRSRQDRILSYTRREILKNYGIYRGSRK